jgi:hypothetical protein
MSRPSYGTFDSPQHDAGTSGRADSSEERNEFCHTSIYSSAITSSGAASTSMTHGQLDSGDDIDLRNFPSRQLQSSSECESRTDVDLQENLHMRISSSSYNYGDENLTGAACDMDSRGMLDLSCKPVTVQAPGMEIDASLTSHPPIPYKLVPNPVPQPDYSELKLKLKASDPQVR